MEWLTRLIFPARCPGCGQSVPSHGDWCSTCYGKVWHPRLLDGSHGTLAGCYCLTEYRGPMRRLLQQLKYHRALKYEAACHYLLARFPWPDVLHADWAVPVPLSPERYEKRGYNQTEVIFRPWIESYAGWYDCLQRVRTTEAQWHLSRSERAANLHKAFSLQDGRPVRGKKILLLDDIYTTGATLEACAKTLKKAGAVTVTGLVMASGGR